MEDTIIIPSENIDALLFIASKYARIAGKNIVLDPRIAQRIINRAKESSKNSIECFAKNAATNTTTIIARYENYQFPIVVEIQEELIKDEKIYTITKLNIANEPILNVCVDNNVLRFDYIKESPIAQTIRPTEATNA